MLLLGIYYVLGFRSIARGQFLDPTRALVVQHWCANQPIDGILLPSLVVSTHTEAPGPLSSQLPPSSWRRPPILIPPSSLRSKGDHWFGIGGSCGSNGFGPPLTRLASTLGPPLQDSTSSSPTAYSGSSQPRLFCFALRPPLFHTPSHSFDVAQPHLVQLYSCGI